MPSVSLRGDLERGASVVSEKDPLERTRGTCLYSIVEPTSTARSCRASSAAAARQPRPDDDASSSATSAATGRCGSSPLESQRGRVVEKLISHRSQAQEQHKEEIQGNVQLEIVKPDVTDEEIDTVLRADGSSNRVMRSAILRNSADPIKDAYAHAADRYQDVLKLEQSVAELHQLFLDFACSRSSRARPWTRSSTRSGPRASTSSRATRTSATRSSTRRS